MSREGTTWISDERNEQIDRLIEWLLVALLVFMPLAFGAVEAWSEQIVLILAGAISVCFLLRASTSRSSCVTWTWAYVPIAIFVLAVFVQLLPLPQGVVRLVSPNTVTRKTELLGDLTNAREILSYVTISFYSHATRHDLRLVLAVVAVFVVVFNVYRRPSQILRLLTTIAIVGAGIAVLALAQNVLSNNKIYWLVSSPHGMAHSGPFVNHSHYAQFMNLSIGAALAVFLVRLRQDFSHRPTTPEAIADYLGSPEARVTWALVAMMILGAATVFLAMSRGGVIGMLIAGAFTSLLLSLKKPLRGAGWIMAMLALGAFICVLYIGFDAVYDRLTTLRDLSRAEGGRWQILKDISVAWSKFPVLGSGLGTHEVVYPEFDRSMAPALASHAENEYAQAVEETGLIGFMALLTFAGFVWMHYARSAMNKQVAACSAVYGLGFGLMAILVHSLSDFGQHLPANAMLTVIFCALVIRLSHTGCSAEEPVSGSPHSTYSRRYWLLGGAAVCMVWAWGLLGAESARVAETHWEKVLAVEANLAGRGWQGTHDEYVYLLDHAARAAECEPDNVKYLHWLNVYRWRSISQMCDPNTGDLVVSEKALEFAGRIVEEFNVARLSCPTFGATWCVLGQLERSILGRDEDGARHIREGVKLAPCDATARFVAGTLALEDGRVDVAFRHLNAAVALDELLFAEVALVLTEQFDQSEMALQIAGEDAGHLSRLVRTLETVSACTDAVKDVRDKAVALLEKSCQEPTTRAWIFAALARTYAQDGRAEEAIEYYRLALDRDYGRIEWRFSLARLLVDIDAVEEALREAETCLRFRPGHTASKRLIERLSVDPRLAGRG